MAKEKSNKTKKDEKSVPMKAFKEHQKDSKSDDKAS
jgi:hypothetical protein